MKWLAVLLLLSGPALAHDEDHDNDQWYESLKQPDNPGVSCCGVADSYWCDEIHVRDGVTYCNITDTRDNEKLHRLPRTIGTEIEIPVNKLGSYNGAGNPTGHSIVFLSHSGWRMVYCFVQGTVG